MAKDVLHELRDINSLKSRRNNVILIFLCFLVGIFSGIIVGTYTLLLKKMSIFRGFFTTNLEFSKIVIGITVFILMGMAVQFMLSKYPLISGSGIPQVSGLLTKKVKFKWFGELITKFVGGILAIGAGMSMGREGPSVHLGALVGSGVKEVTKRSEVEEKYLVTCGASAGISSTFNAPLAGVIFSLEELHKFFSPLLLICTLVASGTSNFVSRMILGSQTSFQYNFMLPKDIPYYIFALITVIFCIIITITGKAFSYFLLLIQRHYRKIKLNKYVKMAIFMILAYVIAVFFSDITGGGHELIEEMFSKNVLLRTLIIILVLKFFYTMLCYATGAPGGIFLPMLVIGALTGKVYGEILNHYFSIPNDIIVHFMLLGMAAYFTAVVRAPITGITLILEMTGNFSYLYMLIIVCTITYIFTELLKMEPIYERLYFNMFHKQILAEDKENSENEKRAKRLEILEKWWKNKKIDIGVKSNRKNLEDKIVTLLIPVGTNSEFDNKTVKELHLPEKLLIVSVRKAGKDSIARGDTLIQSGSQLVIITDYTTAQKYAGELKEKGMKIVE
ncbi:ClC family H(+)/Cl(-) exchange transporter [Leptotrichia trevisanii]|uniref:Chloride channel core n=1 Tax=Leptotrichia trevisanii TaxID=109328 RepID=A0A510K551_9FUSO|nr:ClC family H(+)/Cl(-) exchange transporter [Leptotrichia trevisanii]BBM45881.1 chloride channel core [Leptotrichia trevisanii]